MYIADTEMSCGVVEIVGLRHDPKDTLFEFGTESPGCAFVQWSDVWGRYKKGNRLYHYIRKTFPRSFIQRTKPAKNPNSHNRICIYTWRIPKNFHSWYKKNMPDDWTDSVDCDEYSIADYSYRF